MSEMNHAGLKPAAEPLLLDWQPNVERIEREAAAARIAGRPDPYAAIEAECWIDQIDAEIAAQQARPASLEADESLAQLRRWRVQLQLAARSLRGMSNNLAGCS
jgi:hypothetical protein